MTKAVSLVRLVTTNDGRFRLHNWLTSRGSTRLAYQVLQPKIRGCVVRPDTELVIEGFARSANTYALAAFRCANGPDTVVADHLHAASSIVRAAHHGIPAIVLIRDPLDACASLIQRQRVHPRTALEAYLRFHTTVLPWLDHAVVSDFPTTIGSFGIVVEALNARFATSYRPYEKTAENEAWCRQFVLDADRRDQGLMRGTTVALPQASRNAGRPAVTEMLLREGTLVDDVRSCYAEVRALAVG
jgi:hypothetical protein